MRLIDLDSEYIQETLYRRSFKTRQDIEEWLNNAPIIDAVPVVRCRDCKHHRDKNEQEQQYLVEDILICTSPDATDDCWNAVWPDHFCSYGERKEGDGNG